MKIEREKDYIIYEYTAARTRTKRRHRHHIRWPFFVDCFTRAVRLFVCTSKIQIVEPPKICVAQTYPCGLVKNTNYLQFFFATIILVASKLIYFCVKHINSRSLYTISAIRAINWIHLYAGIFYIFSAQLNVQKQYTYWI